MIVASLIMVVMLFAFLNANAWRADWRWFCFFVLVSTGGLGLFFTPVLIFAAQMFAIETVCRLAPRWRRRLYLPGSCAAFVVAFGIPSVWAVQEMEAIEELWRRYPYESLEQRLADQREDRPRDVFPNSAARRTSALEEMLYRDAHNARIGSLERLQFFHEHQVLLFMDTPGFGIGRFPMPSERLTSDGVRVDEVVQQPERGPAPTDDSSAETRRSESLGDAELLETSHLHALADFLYSAGFGYVKDRRHVSGFQAHRFSTVPAPVAGWSVRRLDLVGLAMHGEPVAYVSDHLPRMDELRNAPTRRLDEFERRGLTALRSGEDLFVEERPPGLRLLGSIRNVPMCVECHGGERGDLLGAFSYRFGRTSE